MKNRQNTEALRCRTILVTGTRAPAGLHAARLLHAAGMRVIAAESFAAPLSLADVDLYPTRRAPSPSAEPAAYGAFIRQLIETEGVDLVLPACEEVFHLSRALDGTDHRALLFAPPAELLLRAHSKMQFPGLLEAAGLAAPATDLIGVEDDLRDVCARAAHSVLKPEYSRFATRTLVRPARRDLERLEGREVTYVRQDYLEGPEVCVYAIAHEGRLTGLTAYRPGHRAGQGASIYFEPVQDDALEAYVGRLVAATGWTGQMGLDVIMTAERGPVAIECNPRATSGIHFMADGPAFAAALLGGARLSPREAPLMISLAMASMGLAGAWRSGELRRWMHDWRRADDALRFSCFSAPHGAMLRSSWQFLRLGRRRNISLLEATTDDIAWNG